MRGINGLRTFKLFIPSGMRTAERPCVFFRCLAFKHLVSLCRWTANRCTYRAGIGCTKPAVRVAGLLHA